MRKFVLAAVLAFLAAWPVEAQYFGVSVELQLAKTQYLPGEDLQLKVRIVNRSGQAVVLGADNDWLSLSIADEDNRPCARRGEMPVQGEFTLLSGEMGTRALNPSPYFEFPRPGRYRITASIQVAQWNKYITCKPVSFTVAYGTAIAGLGNLQFGMPGPPGETNTPPEVRAYSLLRVTSKKEPELYFRLTDGAGRNLRVFPLARMLSFSEPEAQIDRDNNLHVLSQVGSKSFIYCIINPEGQWVARQTHIYTETRPELRVAPDGRVFVANGARRFSPDDYPPSSPESAKRQ